MRDLDRLSVPRLLDEAVCEAPDRPFVVHSGGSISYAQFNALADAAAARWAALGVRKGDRVAFMVGNSPEFIEAWLGLAKVGGILVALNTKWTQPEIERYLSLTQPRLALADAAHVDVMRAATGRTSSIDALLTLGDGHGVTRFQDIVPLTAGIPTVDLESIDEVSFISTSGTTGRPKSVMQTHGNFVLTGEGYAGWMALRPGERLYVCLPLFHINSQAYSVMGALAARASIVLVERFSASRFWSDVAAYGVDVFNYIGSMLAILLKAEPSEQERAHHARLSYGGPALPGPVRDEAERRFGLTLISGIGMSENTFGLIESIDGERRPGSLGKPRQHSDPRIVNEARVVDDDGRDVPADVAGELIFRNPVLMKGYYRDPEQSAKTIRDGWLHTGDLVTVDRNGFFYFVDRKKDIVRVRGENVSSAEVEQVLTAQGGVLEAAVVGVPSDLGDEDLYAFVVTRPDVSVTEQALREWCDSRLAPFKIPARIWETDSLPKTETQRVEKHRLRDRARQLVSSDDCGGPGE